MNPVRPGGLLAYGLFGLPLALVGLPVYVYVPAMYAEQFGLSLGMIGAALLGARLLDAFTDPLIGRAIDRARSFRIPVLLGAPLLALGFLALFLPPAAAHAHPLTWFIVALVATYAGYSASTIAHQGWGAALSQAPGERTRITATREAFGVVGVLLAAVLLQFFAAAWLARAFLLSLAIAGGILLVYAPHPPLRTDDESGSTVPIFRSRAFRWLFGSFLLNGTAAAIPATLFLFFARDQLRLGDLAGVFLLLYFLAAAASLPLWAFAGRRYGEARAWLASMLLAVAAFIWAGWLGEGQAIGFGIVCIVSGAALGADLCLPAALLSGVIRRAGHSGSGEGAYFGAWNWAAKINLALAAGIALPLLERLGYSPGMQGADATDALRLAYALIPCLLKLLAAAVLFRAPLQNI